VNVSQYLITTVCHPHVYQWFSETILDYRGTFFPDTVHFINDYDLFDELSVSLKVYADDTKLYSHYDTCYRRHST